MKNILLCNDDGIHAPGIRVLYESVKDTATIHVVAPSEEQSAVGHAITLFEPLKAQSVYRNGSLFGTGVSGTPADCVKLAICELLDGPPDLLLSGINLGPNTGISVIYSGTVSAATEATILGIPSMAFSINTFTDPLWETASKVVRDMVERHQKHGLPEGVLLNVNIPNLPFAEIKGYVVAPMGQSRFVEKFHKRNDPRGNVYYWLDGKMEKLDDSTGTDIDVVENGYVALTPIGLDLTRYSVMDQIRGMLD